MTGHHPFSGTTADRPAFRYMQVHVIPNPIHFAEVRTRASFMYVAHGSSLQYASTRVYLGSSSLELLQKYDTSRAKLVLLRAPAAAAPAAAPSGGWRPRRRRRRRRRKEGEQARPVARGDSSGVHDRPGHVEGRGHQTGQALVRVPQPRRRLRRRCSRSGDHGGERAVCGSVVVRAFFWGRVLPLRRECVCRILYREIKCWCVIQEALIFVMHVPRLQEV